MHPSFALLACLREVAGTLFQLQPGFGVYQSFFLSLVALLKLMRICAEFANWQFSLKLRPLCETNQEKPSMGRMTETGKKVET